MPDRSHRVDAALTLRGLARSRSQAQAYIASGWVLVNGSRITKPSHRVTAGDEISLTASDPYVSRAAHKLRGALTAADVRPQGRALDAGASTGGFTQVLLESGCDPVYALDVGHGQLAPQLAADPRVRSREGLNVRDLTLTDLDDNPVDWLVADLSFISLKLVLAPLLAVLAPPGGAMLLVKPQFEVGREALGPGGIVRSDEQRTRAVAAVAAEASRLGRTPRWQGESVLPGQDGNVEYFLLL